MVIQQRIEIERRSGGYRIRKTVLVNIILETSLAKGLMILRNNKNV